MKKFVYLISPSKIDKKFYSKLDIVLSYGNVKFFQLRIKKIKNNNLINIVKKIRNITLRYKVKFIINDNYVLAANSKADGCHMGQLDGSVEIAKRKLRNKILGVSALGAIGYYNKDIILNNTFADKIKRLINQVKTQAKLYMK